MRHAFQQAFIINRQAQSIFVFDINFTNYLKLIYMNIQITNQETLNHHYAAPTCASIDDSSPKAKPAKYVAKESFIRKTNARNLVAFVICLFSSAAIIIHFNLSFIWSIVSIIICGYSTNLLLFILEVLGMDFNMINKQK